MDSDLFSAVRAFHNALVDMPPGVTPPTFWLGQVMSDQGDGTLTIAIDEGSEEIDGIPKLRGDTPVGSVILLINQDNSWIVAGSLDTGDEWIPFTPTFNNVTLGSGGTTYGWYRRVGNFVEYKAGFTLGTGGSVSGTISMVGPFSVAAIIQEVGTARMRDDSAGFAYTGAPTTSGSVSSNWINSIAYNGTAGVAANTPFTWAVNDSLVASGTIILD